MTSNLPIFSANAFLAISDACCWKCEKEIRVVCVFCADGEVDGERRERFVVSDLVEADHALVEAFRSFPHFRVGFSRTADLSYFANHCDGCGSLQGDFYLHSEPGGAFFPETSADVERITFSRIDSAIRCDGSEGYGTMSDAFDAWSRSKHD